MLYSKTAGLFYAKVEIFEIFLLLFSAAMCVDDLKFRH
jgi:hypothetical protein